MKATKTKAAPKKAMKGSTQAAMKATKTKAAPKKAMKGSTQAAMKATKTKAKGKAEAEGKDITLHFSFVTGATITRTLPVSHTIASVLEGIYAVGSELTFNGKRLDDDRTLSDYNIKKASTLHVVVPRPAPTTPDPRREPPRAPVVYSGSRPWWMSESYYQFADGS